MGTHRQSSSRVIGVHSLPTAVISLIKEQAATQGLYRDPLPDVTHAVRTELVTSTTGWFGRERRRRQDTELLLTADALVVVDRDPDGSDADAEVTFHHLDQLEVARVDGPERGLELVGTPLGATERGSRVVETDGGPEIDRFHRALLEATENTENAESAESSGRGRHSRPSHHVDVPASRYSTESEVDTRSPEFS